MNRAMSGDTYLSEVHEIKLANAARCAVELRDRGESTISVLVPRTGLSRPTVTAGIEMLMEKGLVGEVDGDKQRGRPARKYRFRNEAGIFIGLDAGAHTIRGIACDLSGRICASQELSSEDLFAHQRLAALSDIIRNLTSQAGCRPNDLKTIGLGLSGLVGPNGTLLVSTRFPEWQGVDIADRLTREFGCDVITDNDINLAALAESAIGAARLYQDVIYVSLGHQVALGLIFDGEIRRGSHSAAGEVSRRTFPVALDENDNLLWSQNRSAQQLFELAATGDVAAEAEVADFLSGIADGLEVLALAIDPDALVIGGGLAQAGPLVIDPLQDRLNARFPQNSLPALKASSLGERSVAYGALIRAATMGTRALLGSDAPMPSLSIAEGNLL